LYLLALLVPELLVPVASLTSVGWRCRRHFARPHTQAARRMLVAP